MKDEKGKVLGALPVFGLSMHKYNKYSNEELHYLTVSELSQSTTFRIIQQNPACVQRRPVYLYLPYVTQAVNVTTASSVENSGNK